MRSFGPQLLSSSSALTESHLLADKACLLSAALQEVTARRRDAQRAVARLLSQEGAVLIGHALHHDLCALRLDFQPVLDTSLLFAYRRAFLPPWPH